MATRYFEDVKIGDTAEFGSKTLSREEIIAFAKKYDPQPFHIDEEAAKSSIYGDIIASGWHTAAVTMRMMVDNMIDTKASLGSPGVDNLRWHKPVRPGDTLRVRTEVIDKKRSRSRPNMGTIFGKLEVINQQDEVVMSFNSIGMTLARTNKPE
ncbi:MaoC family dehydratase [Sneathiella glossodoripedis]|uniref:MaoC family dehydratase n=1 Tax=Sneathiella glossodoripedis TaxID=418853 RepID=UPI000471895A|nr:MaoC family dehydratase [Sneathiella glossodoripedis]